MTVTVNTISAEGFRHTVQIDEHELFTDVPTTAGGEGSAPEPHDYFDAALGACKALTLKLYAKKKTSRSLVSVSKSNATTARNRKANTPCT